MSKMLVIHSCGPCPYFWAEHNPWICTLTPDVIKGSDLPFPAWCPLPDASQQYYLVGEENEWDRLCRERADASRKGPCTLKQEQADELDRLMGAEFWEEHREDLCDR